INLELLEEYLSNSKSSTPKFMYVTPNFHNPAGILYTEKRKRDLIQAIRKYNFPLIEDDAYGELYFNEEARKRSVPMKAIYENEIPICYLGSFSKILGPGFRLGWMLVPPEVYQKAEMCKQSFDACSPNFTQVLANEFLKSGRLEKYVAGLRTIYKRRKDTMVAAIRNYFPEEVTWVEPQGGFYMWIKIPSQLNLLSILKTCIEKGTVFVVGKAFDPEGVDNSHFRLAYSHTPEDKIEKGIKILGDTLKEAMKR
ncbi:MAG: PLP-dependent aminotransferase family protein, partial [Ignavibacteriaceae bacterium]|nr:PLP-dependent aminotransferase family protein [Ignavibacteriaceae bacterium]